MSYEHSGMGEALKETIDEMFEGQITGEFAQKILKQFENSTKKVLTEKVTTNLSFTSSKLGTFRLSRERWVLCLRNVEFKQLPELGIVDKVKIIAYSPNESQYVRFYKDHIIPEQTKMYLNKLLKDN